MFVESRLRFIQPKSTLLARNLEHFLVAKGDIKPPRPTTTARLAQEDSRFLTFPECPHFCPSGFWRDMFHPESVGFRVNELCFDSTG